MPNILKRLSKAFSRDQGHLINLDDATPSQLAMLSRIGGAKEREFIEMRLGVALNKFEDYSSYLQTGHKTVWATYRACKIIAATLISAQFKMLRDTKEDQTDDVTGKSGWFLSRPNEFDSWVEVVEMWLFHMELCGNAYWLKDEPDLMGRPKAIYPLLPQHMRVIPDKSDRVSHYIYHVQGKEIRFNREDVIHFKANHPTSLVMGMGSIEPSESLYNNYINRNTLEERFMENGAQPSGILVREDAVENQGQWEALKRKFTDQYGGKKNAGKTAFLNGKWAYHKLGMSMAEMQSLDREKWCVEQIFLNHGVPLSVAGVDGAANYATARQDEINFRKYKAVPLLDMLVSKINSDGFFRGAGEENIFLTYAMSGLIDVEQILKEYMPLVEQGAMTRNELREMTGLEMVDEVMLDSFLIPANLIPIEMAGFGDPEAAIDAEEDEDDDLSPDEEGKAARRRRRRAIRMSS